MKSILLRLTLAAALAAGTLAACKKSEADAGSSATDKKEKNRLKPDGTKKEKKVKKSKLDIAPPPAPATLAP